MTQEADPKVAVHRWTTETLSLRIFKNSQENTHSEVHSKRISLK